MDTILRIIETIRYKVATQNDTQKLLLTSAAAAFAVAIFFFGVLGFYWDGKDYIISMDAPHHLNLKKDTHSGHNTEDLTDKGSEKKDQKHEEKSGEAH